MSLAVNGDDTQTLFSVGLISDIQYADVEDRLDFEGKQVRRYRQTMDALDMAIADFNQVESPKLSCVMQLGDLLDGYNASFGREYSLKMAHTLLNKFHQDLHCSSSSSGSSSESRSEARSGSHHLIGNHELYCLRRSDLKELLHPHYSYHAFSPHPGWLFIVLDTYDLNVIEPFYDMKGSASESSKAGDSSKATEASEADDSKEVAYKMLEAHNPNDVRDHSGKCDWKNGLEGKAKRFLPFNGALSETQLQWLGATLEKAKKDNENVIIFSHVPLCPGSCDDVCLLWNYEQVLELLVAHAPRVKAAFAGHDHEGGYYRHHGIHFVTMTSSLNAPPEAPTAHGVLHVKQQGLFLKGSSYLPTRELYF